MENVPIYLMEYSKYNFKEAINCAFHYVESYDHIVGTIYSKPSMIKALVLQFPDEVKFDYIHQGIGTFRTAYLKYLPTVKQSIYLFVNRDENFKLKLKLI